jgi:putative transcription antitermination factor YqgF
MRILAIDYGSRRIGLALSDPTGTLARPLPFLPAKADAKLAREIAALAKKEEVELILLGLPRHMNGSLGEAAAKVQAFAEVLGQATPIPINSSTNAFPPSRPAASCRKRARTPANSAAGSTAKPPPSCSRVISTPKFSSLLPPDA